MVHFVGAGSGAADLITVRGAKLLGECDVVIYAGSLVNPALLAYCRKDCRIYNSAEMTLEQVIDAIRKAEAAGETTVRLHTGDSSIFGAVREQFDELDKLGIAYDVCPGVSAFCGAAASLNPADLDWIAALLFVAALFVLRRWKLNPIWVMVGTGVVGLGLYLIIGY